MDTSLVFVANIPFYVYYNCSALPSLSPRYRSLAINEDTHGISLNCFDGAGREVMPYPEYVLALFTYLFEVRGRYKKRLKIHTLDGTHTYDFFVDSAHNYGVNVELCKEILTYNINLQDYSDIYVTDFQGYDLIRLMYVNNLDCFSPTVLKELRFLTSGTNCARAVSYSYMGALRLICEPECDLSAEMLVSIALSLRSMRIRGFTGTLLHYPTRVELSEQGAIYFTSCTHGNYLDSTQKI